MVASSRARGLGAIAHPLALVALAVLFVNDAFLKGAVPGVVTGKLSDLAGLVVLTLVVATVLGVVVRDDDRVVRWATASTGTWFAAMKTLPAVAAATERLAELVVPSSSIVVDPTDLVALPGLLVAAHLWHRRLAPRTWAVPVLLVASVWSMATSCDGQDWSGDVHVLADGSFLVELDATWEVATLAPDGSLVEVAQRPRGADLPNSPSSLEACLPDGTCVTGDGHDVLERDDQGVRRVLDVPEDRLAYSERVAAGCATRLNGVTDVAANDDGVVVVAHGMHGISVRTPDGSWSRAAVERVPLERAGTPFAPRLGTWMLVVAGFLLAAMPSSRGLAVSAIGGTVMLAAMGLALLANSDWATVALLVVAPAVMLGVLVLAAPRAGGQAWLGWTAAAHLAAGVAAEVLLWSWASGWVEQYAVVATLSVVLVLVVTTTSVATGATNRVWPMPLRPRPPVPTWRPPPPPPEG